MRLAHGNLALAGALVMVLFTVLVPGVASAQTVLLVVVEAANSQPLPPPLAVREGLSATLFDSGCIVLDSPGSTVLPGLADVARIARSAGAEVALEVATEYSDTSLDKNLLRISARTTYLLVDPSTNGVLARGTRTATNQDREHDVGRTALGVEIGKDLGQVVRTYLDGHPVKGG